jgi:hypothetical protein
VRVYYNLDVLSVYNLLFKLEDFYKDVQISFKIRKFLLNDQFLQFGNFLEFKTAKIFTIQPKLDIILCFKNTQISTVLYNLAIFFNF